MVPMAYHSGKTEHSGSKKGRGAFWGRKKQAKKGSTGKRRIEDKKSWFNPAV
jgi:hypothetical protein